MKTLEELKKILKKFPNESGNSKDPIRNMFDLKLITYSECIVLRKFVLDSNL